MILVAVDAARGDQTEAVQRTTAITRAIDQRAQGGVVEERPVRDRAVDARERLQHEPAGADGEMPDLGVALLTRREPDRLAARLHERVRPARLERIELGRPRRRRSRCRTGRGVSPPVEDDEDERPHTAHLELMRRLTTRGRRLPAAVTIAANSGGSQARAADQRAVDVGLRKQRRGVRRRHAAAVEHARRARQRRANVRLDVRRDLLRLRPESRSGPVPIAQTGS